MDANTLVMRECDCVIATQLQVIDLVDIDTLVMLLLLHFSSLTLSGTNVYKPGIRALLGTASHICEVVVLKLRIVMR